MGVSGFGIAVVLAIPTLLLTIALIVGLWALLRHRRVSIAECGCCRYPVKGLTAWTCPECGSDFRDVGIAAPGMFTRRRIGHAGAGSRLASPQTRAVPSESA